MTTGWTSLIQSALARRDAFDARVRAALQLEYTRDRMSQIGTLHTEMSAGIARMLAGAIATAPGGTNEEVLEMAAAGEAWARRGIPVDEMLRAWNVGVEAAIAYIRGLGDEVGIDDGDLLEFVQSAHAWSAASLVAAARGHREAELELAVATEERREAFVRGLLFGTLGFTDINLGAEAYGLDPAGEYVAVRARLGDRLQQQKLEQAMGFHSLGKSRSGLCAIVDGALAGILLEPPAADIGGVIGVGPQRPLRYIADSYRLATRALMTMQACGLRGAHEFESLGLRTAVAHDSDVGDSLRRKYLEPLSVGDSARELIGTLRAYIACDLHVERTATRLYVHQNTVRYRLARFEELTGASLRSTRVIVELWWALALSEMDL